MPEPCFTQSVSGDVTVSLTGQQAQSAQGNLTPWISATFAPHWFADALSQVSPAADRQARRKEIIFAVSCAESYLFEWVRDDVLKGDHHVLERYFPVNNHRSVHDKWRDIPKQLKGDGRILEAPNLGGSIAWQDFQDLIDFRNGLLHARASRPETPDLPTPHLPVPSMRQLDGLTSGWAAGVVRRLILELNTAAGTRPPTWATEK